MDKAKHLAINMLSRESVTNPGKFNIYLATGFREERMIVTIVGTEALSIDQPSQASCATSKAPVSDPKSNADNNMGDETVEQEGHCYCALCHKGPTSSAVMMHCAAC